MLNYSSELRKLSEGSGSRSDRYSSRFSKLFSNLSFLTTFPFSSNVVHTLILECISIPVYVGSSPPKR